MEVSSDPQLSSEPDAALGGRLRRIHLTAVGVAVAWVVAAAAGTWWLSARTLHGYMEEAASVAAADVKAVSGVVDQTFRALAAMPRVLANSGELQAIAKRYSARGEAFSALPRDERARQLRSDADVARVNAKLTAVRGELDYDLIYALDTSGIRIVSSDWDEPMTLLGERLDDREYFKKAIDQGAGHLFAVARTTRVPVLFFSASIEDQSGPVGVVVVRQDSYQLGTTLASGKHLAMLVDSAGVVVASSRRSLTLRHLGKMVGSPPDAAAAREVYGQDPMVSIDVSRRPQPLHEAEWIFEGHAYLLTSVAAANSYQLLMLTPVDSVQLTRPLHYAIGALSALFGVLFAVLGSRRAEARERQRHHAQVTATLNERLVTLNKDKDRYLGIAAHDLRNPLSSMRGLAELLMETPVDPEQRREFLDTIRGTSDEMLGLVNDLLDTSVIESGKLDLRRKDQDMAALVKRRIRSLEPQARRKEISLEVDADKGNAAIDPARFGQVIDNLVSNAIKFSPTGTTVRIAVQVEGDRCLFSVQDQGPGIPAADRALMFRSFQKLSAQPTGGEKSTGLGLAIVKKIVEAHRGTITVDDAPGGGTRFTVTTPVADPGAAGSGPFATTD